MKKIIIIGAVLLGVCVGIWYSVGKPVFGNPTAVSAGVATASATTTVQFMTPGTATTTLCYDSYSITGSCTSGATGRPLLPSGVTGLVQLTGSSTNSILRINVEYSQDNQDWYQDGGVLNENFATTSKPFDISQVNQLQFAFSSSTPGFPALHASTSATTTRAFNIRVPTRYVRFIFTVPTGSANLAFWASILPKREQSVQ